MAPAVTMSFSPAITCLLACHQSVFLFRSIDFLLTSVFDPTII